MSEPRSQPRYPFPRPGGGDEILVLGDGRGGGTLSGGRHGGAVGGGELFRLLTHPAAHEAFTQCTKDAGSIRLLVSDGWVFKCRPPDVLERRDETLERLAELAAHTARLGIWHPAKTWFALRRPNGYLLANACPRLVTLDRHTGLPARLRWEPRRLSLLLRALLHRHLLDPKRRNFGIDPGRRRLYYLDDEVYTLDGHTLSFS